MRSYDSIAINAASVSHAGPMSGAKPARLPLHCSFVRLDPQFALFANQYRMKPHPKENDQEAAEDSGPKSSPSIGEKLKELLTAKPASYSEDEEPRRAEKRNRCPPRWRQLNPVFYRFRAFEFSLLFS